MPSTFLRLGLAIVVACFLTASSCRCQSDSVPNVARYKSDPHFIAAIAEAKKLTAENQPTFAVNALGKANKISGGKCIDCLVQIITLDLSMNSNKDVVKEAEY
jgi:hypothetical protein